MAPDRCSDRALYRAADPGFDRQQYGLRSAQNHRLMMTEASPADDKTSRFRGALLVVLALAIVLRLWLLFTVRATEEDEAQKLMADAQLLEQAGCFALVLEKIPAALATRVAKMLTIPVIGIGAGGGVDGQVLVIHDMLGINKEFKPRFLRRYLNLYDEIHNAVGAYCKDIKSGDFPNGNEQY